LFTGENKSSTIILQFSICRCWFSMQLIAIPCCSIFYWSSNIRTSGSFTCSPVNLTLARHVSGPHAVREAFCLTGVAEAFLFFLAALLTALEARAHG
jgi:hypothetical protein